MSDVENVDKFLKELSTQKREVPPFSFFVREIGWINIKYFVYAVLNDETFVEALSMDGRFHRIRESEIIDVCANIQDEVTIANFKRLVVEATSEDSLGPEEGSSLYG